MALEASIDPRVKGAYPFGDELTGDWEPLLDAIRADLRRRESVAAIATRFHRALVGWICRVARAKWASAGRPERRRVQNAFLADQSSVALAVEGHVAHTHHRVPANDGGPRSVSSCWRKSTCVRGDVYVPRHSGRVDHIEPRSRSVAPVAKDQFSRQDHEG